MKNTTTWVEISKSFLSNNIKEFKKIISPNTLLSVCVKSNAYGHGLVETSKIFIDAGADFLDVNSVYEARSLRQAGIKNPIYVMGYVLESELEEVVDLDLHIVVYNEKTVSELARISEKKSKTAKIHIKIETGNNRQGIRLESLASFASFISQFKSIKVEGIATHFANIEDTTDHSFAMSQVSKFKKADSILKENGITAPIRHCANSAATILFPETHFEMVRIGISAYGMWPSNETLVSYKSTGKKDSDFSITPALCWKSIVAQVKTVPKGEYIGYGCTCRPPRDTIMAIIPVGYYDGYDRGLSNNGHVLIHGQRAKILGRICMNIMMVDITDIPDVLVEDEVVLIGNQKFGDFYDNISPEQFSSWISSINYEVISRINERIPRFYEK